MDNGKTLTLETGLTSTEAVEERRAGKDMNMDTL